MYVYIENYCAKNYFMHSTRYIISCISIKNFKDLNLNDVSTGKNNRNISKTYFIVYSLYFCINGEISRFKNVCSIF